MTTKLPIICWTKARNGHGELEAKEDLLGAVDIIELQLQTQKPRKWIWVFFRELKLLSISEFRILSERENNCYRDSTKEVEEQFQPFRQVSSENINGSGRNHCCHANLANSAILLPSNENASASTTTATQDFRPAETTMQSQQSTSTSTKTSTTGMQVIERYLESKNIYEKAADIILSFWRTGTQKQYTTHINK